MTRKKTFLDPAARAQHGEVNGFDSPPAIYCQGQIHKIIVVECPMSALVDYSMSQQ